MLDARFPGKPRDSCGSGYMDGMEGFLPALHIETHRIHDALDTRHGSDNGAIIIDVGIDRLEKGSGVLDAATPLVSKIRPRANA